MRFHYQVYGLPLLANRAIPGLVGQPAAATNQWQVRLGSMPAGINAREISESACLYVSNKRSDDGEPSWKICRLAEENYLRFRFYDGTDFVIDRHGRRIWATWPEPLTLEDTATYLVGPVLGFILRLTGTTCLHASAVAVGSRAVAFVGAPGSGKSTTAAAFTKLGYAILSDDIVALSERSGNFVAEPGYPRLNLWPDSASAVCGSADGLPRITPTWDKRYLNLCSDRRRFQPQPLRLAAVYIFGARTDDPNAPFVDGLPVHRGLIELIGNSYANHLLDHRQRAEEFSVLGHLANALPLRRLIPNADPSLLPQLCRAILDDVHRLTFAATEQHPPQTQ
jgi:hypothetical protein